MGNARQSASRSISGLEILNASENLEVGIPFGTKPTAPKFVEQARCETYKSEMPPADGENQQAVNKVHVAPSEREQIPLAESGISCGDDEGGQVCSTLDT